MSSAPWSTLFIFLIIIGTMLCAWYIYHQKVQNSILLTTLWSQQKPLSGTRMFDSGWDERAFVLFRRAFQELYDHKVTRTVMFPIGGLTARVNDIDADFWSSIEKGHWERHTYATFMRYITSDTIVVDFGAWIGPTVLFSGQLAARTYAIEADPVAFAKLSYNVKQNVQASWYNRVQLQAGCVGVESSLLEMKSAAPGNSMSSFHKIFQEKSDSVTVNWTVHCYSLSAFFKAWDIDPEMIHAFIKIDIESYECILLPSLYSWLANMRRKPTLYIAMHSQIVACTNDQYEVIAKLIALYRFRDTKFIDEKGKARGTGDYVLSDVIAPA